jgi:hypothetical protein
MLIAKCQSFGRMNEQTAVQLQSVRCIHELVKITNTCIEKNVPEKITQ